MHKQSGLLSPDFGEPKRYSPKYFNFKKSIEERLTEYKQNIFNERLTKMQTAHRETIREASRISYSDLTLGQEGSPTLSRNTLRCNHYSQQISKFVIS